MSISRIVKGARVRNNIAAGKILGRIGSGRGSLQELSILDLIGELKKRNNGYLPSAPPVVSGGGGALTKISKVTTVSSATTISFSSIPATYSDLLLVIQGRSQTSALFENIHMVLNSDTSTNYNSQQLNIHSTTLTATETLGTAYALIGAMTGATAAAAYAGQISLELANYAATLFKKTWTARNQFSENDSSVNTFVQTTGGMWKSTAAISQIDITTASGGAFVDGTTAVLYGRG